MTGCRPVVRGSIPLRIAKGQMARVARRETANLFDTGSNPVLTSDMKKMFNCKYCNKSIGNKGGLGMHESSCKDNPNRKKRTRSPLAGSKKGSIGWNKGMKTPAVVRNKISKSLIGKSKGVALTEEKEELRKKRISESMKKNPNSGGLRKKSGRGIKGRYKGFWCDSTWELAWVIYNIEHGIEFVRNWKGFEYKYNGKICKYYPDFKLNGVYIEIKGRRSFESLSEKDKAKIESFVHKLDVLYESDMSLILNYVIKKHGKKFYKLYE